MRAIDGDALFREMEKSQWYNNADRDEIAEELVLNAPTIESRCESCEAFNKTRLLIPQSQRTGRWIPCSERLPERCQNYIVTDFGTVSEVYYDSNGRWFTESGNKLKDVTAWMPLPEPYAERRTDE